MKLCPLKRQLCKYADYSNPPTPYNPQAKGKIEMRNTGVCSFNAGAIPPGRPQTGRDGNAGRVTASPLQDIKICPRDNAPEKQEVA